MSAGAIEWIGERGGHRVGIEGRKDGRFQVHLERWVPGSAPEEPSYWSPLRARVVIAESAASARALAVEELDLAVPVKA